MKEEYNFRKQLPDKHSR